MRELAVDSKARGCCNAQLLQVQPWLEQKRANLLVGIRFQYSNPLRGEISSSHCPQHDDSFSLISSLPELLVLALADANSHISISTLIFPLP